MNHTSFKIVATLIGVLLLSSFVCAKPRIKLSSRSVEQGDTLRISIKSKKALQQGTIRFNQKPLTIFKDPNPKGRGFSYVCYVGIPRSIKPENYPILISLLFKTGNREVYKRHLDVKDANFPVQAVHLPKNKEKIAKKKSTLSKEAGLIGQAFKSITRERYFTKKFIMPAKGRISSEFGAYRTYNGKESRRHAGVDIANKAGTPLVAPNDGKVVMATRFEHHGNTVMIDHGLGVTTIYNHMQEISVKEGDFVKKGESIGLMGETGVATGPHVHWGMSVQNTRVDPRFWLGHSFLYK